jgi:hypothetical protein
MRKILSLALALILVSSVAFAADFGYPARGDVRCTTLSPTTCTHVTTGPALVWRVTIKAKQAAAWIALADSAQTGISSAATHWTAMQTYSNLKTIVQEPTQYDTTVVEYNPPVYFQNGIFFIEGYSGTLETGNGGDGVDCIIEYTGAE